jgi:ubiquinone/menaquinone biosynthesis C-methylase UbiE
MIHNNDEVLSYWQQENVESMYDKYLLNAEIDLIKTNILPNSKILDAGCGEGEGTLHYSKIPGVTIHATDFSDTRLKKAKENLKGVSNVILKKIDFLGEYELDDDYDIIITQRFLINLMEFDLQKKVIINLMNRLKENGQFLMLEGSKDGVDELNAFRKIFSLDPIPIKWHNLFFKNSELENFLNLEGFKIIDEIGLGDYFLLTRGIRPVFDKKLDWNVNYNRIASTVDLKEVLKLNTRFSRLMLWVITK